MSEFHIFIHNGSYVTVSGDYNCDPDIVANLGETWEDYLEGKYILLNEEQESYVNEHPESTPREAFFMQEDTEASVSDKSNLIERINTYDSSEEVNTFYVNGIPVWFSKDTRISLNNSISIEKEFGKETTVLWVNNIPYTMSVDDAKQMLVDIELYAIACYNNTQNNIAEVNGLTLKADVKAFDITKGYPEKLNFNL